MKNLFFLLILFLSTANVLAQNNFQLSPSPRLETASSYNYVPQADDEITLTWLTTDNVTQKIGLSVAAPVAAFMEFYIEDILNFKGMGKKPVAIKQVQFHLIDTEITSVSACRIVIRKGTSINSSVEVYSQNVTNFTGGWNYVDLDANYTIEDSQNLYIGYEVTQTRSASPLSLIQGNETKQGWIFYNGAGENVVDMYGYMFAIKAIALTETSPANAFIIQSLNISDYKLTGEKLSIEGVIKNIGTANLTSFILEYQANEANPVSYSLTDLNIAPNATYTFKHPDSLVISEAKTYSISVTLKEPNGDENFSRSQSINLQGLVDILPRVLLHESFTSSTCGPCKAGNTNLKNVLNSVDENQWANIRYQMNWPSTGDPYYTLEGGVKRDLYGITAVPFLVVDGKWGGNSGDYTKAIFDRLAAIPAITALSATAETVGKTVNAGITITPATTMNTQNLRLFAAVVEKNTTKNKKSNGETEFLNVMKKFLTDVNGNPIGNFEVDIPQTIDLSYTFNGDYRLPSDAGSPINHATEHSVEDFNNLIVVYWIQNMQSGVVLQSGKTEATLKTGLSNIATSSATAYIYDNSLYIRSDAPVRSIDIYSVSGQKVLSTTAVGNVIPVEKLPQGIYVVKVKTALEEKVAKVIK
jgi:hypothetical protein